MLLGLVHVENEILPHQQHAHHYLHMGLNVPVPNFEEIKLGSLTVSLSNKACDLRQVDFSFMPFLVSLLVRLGALIERAQLAMAILQTKCGCAHM
jgi:hypothetical protein